MCEDSSDDDGSSQQSTEPTAIEQVETTQSQDEKSAQPQIEAIQTELKRLANLFTPFGKSNQMLNQNYTQEQTSQSVSDQKDDPKSWSNHVQTPEKQQTHSGTSLQEQKRILPERCSLPDEIPQVHKQTNQGVRPSPTTLLRGDEIFSSASQFSQVQLPKRISESEAAVLKLKIKKLKLQVDQLKLLQKMKRSTSQGQERESINRQRNAASRATSQSNCMFVGSGGHADIVKSINTSKRPTTPSHLRIQNFLLQKQRSDGIAMKRRKSLK